MEEYSFLIVGSFMSIGGVFMMIKTDSIRNNGIIISAKVVGHKEVIYDGDLLKHEIYEFELEDRKLIRSTNMIGSTMTIYKKGQKVDIIYDPFNPSKVMYNKPFVKHLYLFPLLVGMILIGVHYFRA